MRHEVTNQSPPLEDVNAFALDPLLKDAVVREGAGHAITTLDAWGAWCGSAEALELARSANVDSPRLKTHDAKGRRLDRVEFHPAYHALMARSVEAGLQGLAASQLVAGAVRRAGAHVERAAAFYMTAGLESGHCCPITMTNAAASALALAPSVAGEWLPKIAAPTYDPRHLPADAKTGVTLGMGMTEKQGGTDVRANTTRAEETGEDGLYLIDGHKWFLSAPMSDAFLMLAQVKGGLTCFLVPRLQPDGRANGLRLQRLKDKLGNRSNASAEVEIEGALASRVGEEGRGVATIIEMVTATRLDCAIASAGLMRVALAEAVHHARHRRVGGQPLVAQPVMGQVLADLALDWEAASVLVFRLARAFDHADDSRAAAWCRLMTPVTKYWVCKLAPPFVAEAMECLGGNGYVEESRLPRIYREAPVNSIWEGSGNVMGLDLLRVLQKEPEVAETVLEEIRQAIGDDPALRAELAAVEGVLHEPRLLDVRARRLAEGLARLAAGAILRAHAPPAVADAFIATRLGGAARQTYGQGIDRFDTKAIIARVLED